MQESPEWREAEGLGAAFSAIKELYQRKARVLENYNESQREEDFIRPVLRILGHFFGVQGKVLGKDRTPDYAFFPDQESLDDAEAHPKEDYYRKAVAVGDAKAWKISLDKSRKGMGLFEMQNPRLDRCLPAGDAAQVGDPEQWPTLATIPRGDELQAGQLLRGGSGRAAGRRRSG